MLHCFGIQGTGSFCHVLNLGNYGELQELRQIEAKSLGNSVKLRQLI